MKVREQKTASAGALTDDAIKWAQVNWDHARREVRRLQMRIAKAVTEERWNKVRALQYRLSRSFYAKLLAVKRVTSNRGKKTPGVDGILWQGVRAKWRAACSLRKRGYKPQPLRRIYIPKKNSLKKRPLSIPCMFDRAMQALYKLALAPIAETMADGNSYGFREGRSCADAIASAFNALSKPNSATWVLEGDIKGCYDNISQEWMRTTFPWISGAKPKPDHAPTVSSGYVPLAFVVTSKSGPKRIHIHTKMPPTYGAVGTSRSVSFPVSHLGKVRQYGPHEVLQPGRPTVPSFRNA